MRQTRWSALFSCVLLVAVSSAADENSKRIEVEKLFKLTHMEQRVNEGVDSVLALQLRQNPELVPQQDKVRAFLEKYGGWNSMKDEITRMYMESFSEDELREMNAFYITPTGQKVLTKVPELVQQRNQLAMKRLAEHVDELRAAIAEPSQGGPGNK